VERGRPGEQLRRRRRGGGSFGGYTIPTRVRVGWHFGGARFEREGEFFRCRIDEARYR